MTTLRWQHWTLALLLALALHLAVILEMLHLPGGAPVWRGGGTFEQIDTPSPGGNAVLVQLGASGESAGETPAPSAPEEDAAPAPATNEALAQGFVAADADEPGADADTAAAEDIPEPATAPAPEPIDAPPADESGPAPEAMADAAEPEAIIAANAIPRRKPRRPNPMPEMEALSQRLSVQAPETARPTAPVVRDETEGPPTRDGRRPGDGAADGNPARDELAFVFRGGRLGTASGNETGNIRELNYGDMVMLWLKRNGEYPMQAARYRLEDTVTIRFAINRQGRILYYKILKPSRWIILNNAVRDMMDRASPVPPIPLDIAQDEITFTVPVHFNPP